MYVQKIVTCPEEVQIFDRGWTFSGPERRLSHFAEVAPLAYHIKQVEDTNFKFGNTVTREGGGYIQRRNSLCKTHHTKTITKDVAELQHNKKSATKL